MIKFTHPHVLKLYEFLLLNIKYDILKNVVIKHLTCTIYFSTMGAVNGFFKISFVINRRKKLLQVGPYEGK